MKKPIKPELPLKEDYDKLPTDEQVKFQLIAKQYQADVQKYEERRRIHFSMTWELVKHEANEVGAGSMVNHHDPHYLPETFTDAAKLSTSFLEFMDNYDAEESQKA